MPRAFPQEFRGDLVVVARKGRAPVAQVAKDFGISESCLHRTGLRHECLRPRTRRRRTRHHQLLDTHHEKACPPRAPAERRPEMAPELAILPESGVGARMPQ